MYSSFSSLGVLLLCGCAPWLGFTKANCYPWGIWVRRTHVIALTLCIPAGALVKNDLLRVFFLGFSMTSQLPHCAVWCFPADCLVGIILVIPLCCFHPFPQQAEATWRWCSGPLLYLTSLEPCENHLQLVEQGVNLETALQDGGRRSVVEHENGRLGFSSLSRPSYTFTLGIISCPNFFLRIHHFSLK